jgi:hypothetical protein
VPEVDSCGERSLLVEGQIRDQLVDALAHGIPA